MTQLRSVSRTGAAPVHAMQHAEEAALKLGLSKPPRNSRGIPIRFIFAALAAVSFAIIYGLKVNLSIAIVRMVCHNVKDNSEVKNLSTSDFNVSRPETENTTCDTAFHWTGSEKGLLLGSYFWGYLISQLPGGRIAELYSGKWVMFVAVLINTISTLLTPVAAYVDIYFLIVLRILEGLGGGITFPAMQVMISNWAPPLDQSLITSIIYAGTALGTVLSFLTSGLIADGLGWEAVFYIQGGLSIIWLVVWAFYIQDSPAKQKYISTEEKEMIMEALGYRRHVLVATAVPWRSVFTSLPFYAIAFCHFFANIGWYMLLLLLPGYMKDILNFDMKQNAVLCAVPFLTLWVFMIVLGKSFDMLELRGILSHTAVRKVATGFVALGGVFLVGVGHSTENKDLAVILMTISVTFYGAMFLGHLGNVIDIAPNYAGTLMAISNTVATIPGITVPVIVEYVLDGVEDFGQKVYIWRVVFYVTAGLNVLAYIFYLIFASGREQKWNKRTCEAEN